MQKSNPTLGRRQFMQTAMKGAALFLVPSVLTTFLPGCKKEEISFESTEEALRKLSNLPRKSDDIFTYFLHSDYDLVSHGELRKCSKTFRSSKVVIKSNFNLFDNIFSDLQMTKSKASNNNIKHHYSHPIYTGIDFYIQRFEMQNNFNLPKETKNVFLIHPALINKRLSIYKIEEYA